MEFLFTFSSKIRQFPGNIKSTNEQKIFISAIIGNILEFYDLALYGVYASQFANLFFPSQNSIHSMIFSWLAFATGLFSRPLGSLFFGFIGDHYGRKKALFSSIFLMSLSTFFIGVLPDFSIWGIAAPIMLFFLRFIQGFSVGGESNGSAIFALEHSSNENLGFKGAIILASSVLGALLAIFSSLLLHSYENSWRISFIFGSLIGLVGLYIRKSLPEVSNLIIQQELPSKKSILQHLVNSLANFPREISLIIFLGAINGSLYYTLFAYSNYHFLKVMHYSYSTSLSLMAFGMTCFVIFLIVTGYFAESIGYRKILQKTCVAILLLIVPCFYLLNMKGLVFSLSAMILLAALTAGVGAPLHAFMLDLFPPNVRYLSVSLGFNLGIAIFGGAAPTIMTWLSNQPYSFFLSSLYSFCISSVTLLLLSKNAKKR
jgi:MHS family proline/betaine transporter-like MFS transporter